jgi:DNA-binding transcriptional MerR regulator
MEKDMKYAIKDLLGKLKTIDYISPDVIPNIDLYMDQITSFMDSQLENSKRHEDDKSLTKTMINNYTKNDLLPPPNKKKYSKEHLLSLIFIYYLKNFLSINDIKTILNPITDKYFGKKDGEYDMSDIYAEIFRMEEAETGKLLKEFSKKYSIAKDTFTDFPEEDQEELQTFAFVCLLSFDIYMKKRLIEKIIDDVIPEADTHK